MIRLISVFNLRSGGAEIGFPRLLSAQSCFGAEGQTMTYVLGLKILTSRRQNGAGLLVVLE